MGKWTATHKNEKRNFIHRSSKKTTIHYITKLSFYICLKMTSLQPCVDRIQNLGCLFFSLTFVPSFAEENTWCFASKEFSSMRSASTSTSSTYSLHTCAAENLILSPQKTTLFLSVQTFIFTWGSFCIASFVETFTFLYLKLIMATLTNWFCLKFHSFSFATIGLMFHFTSTRSKWAAQQNY